MSMRIVAYVPDLMDRSKVAAAADVTFVNRPDGLAGVSGWVIGFARHTEPALMAAAQAAGCDVVLPRSSFFAQLDELLGG